jgi:hypothetical protein
MVQPSNVKHGADKKVWATRQKGKTHGKNAVFYPST